MQIVVTGGTGFIGRTLVAELVEAGHQVTVLTRRIEPARRILGPTVRLETWLGSPGWEQILDGADAVVNLAGEPIAAGRWTPAAKQRILQSRVEGTRALVAAMKAAKAPPSIFISGSAVGYYGHRSSPATEEVPVGSDFLAGVCSAWEQAARAAEALGVRVVLLRIGVVLGEEGGALSRMLLPFRLFVGGPLGSGQQPFPWIHLCDLTGLIRFALENPAVSGPLNAVAPEAHNNASFSRELGQVIGRPSWLPAPGFAMRLALGEMADAMLLNGQAVTPAVAKRLGYNFRFPALPAALRDLLRR